MARQGIGTGSSPNDGTGDNLRTAGGKINDNFTEVYNYFGDGTNLSFSGGVWDTVSTGINTLSSVGIGTTNPRFTLEVGAVGASGTSLYVNGDARVTGILTVGSSSISLNGFTNEITVGTGITISGNTGIISATQVNIGGETLTGAGVTSLVAGSNITLSGSTGQITISSSGGGGGGGSGITTANINADTLTVTGVSTLSGGVVVNGSGNVSLDNGNVSLANGSLSLGSGGIQAATSSQNLNWGPGNFYFNSGSPEIGWISGAGTLRAASSSGVISIKGGNPGEDLGVFKTGSAAELYYNNVKKFETSGIGVTITGDINSTNLDTGTGYLTLGNSSSQFDIRFSPGSGSSPAIRYNLTNGISVYNRYNGGADLLEDVRFGTSNTLVKNITPFNDSTYNLGTNTNRFVTVYSDNTVTGNVNATSAQVGAALNLQYSNNTSTISHNNVNGLFNIESVSAINLKPGPSGVLAYDNNDELRFKTTTEGANIYGNLSVGIGSTEVTNTPSLTLSHNNPTVVSTAGTTGQFKQIGGQPYYYDGTTWRALFLSEAPLTVNQADSDWDNTMIRMNFDQANIGAVTNLKDGRTPSVSQVDLVASPLKYGTKSARLQVNNNGINFSQNNSGSVYYPFEGAWTMEGWFYFDYSSLPAETNITQSPVLFSNYSPSINTGFNWKIGYYKHSGSVYNFYWYNANSTDTGSNGPGNSGTGFQMYQVAAAYFANNAWHHFAIVRQPSNGSIHFYLDGIESGNTSSNQLIDNEISDTTTHSFNIGHYGGPGSVGQFQGNIDDVRISKSARYTSNFTAPSSALPITGSTTTIITPPDSKVGEISLGSSPVWTGTPGVTASQVAAGQYRATFATAYSNATDYVIQTSMNDYTPATTPVSIGVSRFTTHADFFIRRVSDGANIDTGSLAIDLFKK